MTCLFTSQYQTTKYDCVYSQPKIFVFQDRRFISVEVDHHSEEIWKKPLLLGGAEYKKALPPRELLYVVELDKDIRSRAVALYEEDADTYSVIDPSDGIFAVGSLYFSVDNLPKYKQHDRIDAREILDHYEALRLAFGDESFSTYECDSLEEVFGMALDRWWASNYTWYREDKKEPVDREMESPKNDPHSEERTLLLERNGVSTYTVYHDYASQEDFITLPLYAFDRVARVEAVIASSAPKTTQVELDAKLGLATTLAYKEFAHMLDDVDYIMGHIVRDILDGVLKASVDVPSLTMEETVEELRRQVDN